METTYINPIINEIEIKSANNRRIYLTGTIDKDMAIKVSYFTNKILEMDKIKPPQNKEITFIINSNGGSVIYGNSILTNIQLMKNNGYKIIGKVESMAYSMAFDILVNCDYRIGGKYSTYLLHQTAFGIGGELKEIENEVEFQKKMWEMSKTDPKVAKDGMVYCYLKMAEDYSTAMYKKFLKEVINNENGIL